MIKYYAQNHLREENAKLAKKVTKYLQGKLRHEIYDDLMPKFSLKKSTSYLPTLVNSKLGYIHFSSWREKNQCTDSYSQFKVKSNSVTNSVSDFWNLLIIIWVQQFLRSCKSLVCLSHHTHISWSTQAGSTLYISLFFLVVSQSNHHQYALISTATEAIPWPGPSWSLQNCRWSNYFSLRFPLQLRLYLLQRSFLASLPYHIVLSCLL